MTPIDFIKNILTGMYREKTTLLTDALKVYTTLIISNQEVPIKTLNFLEQEFSIPTEYYNEALKLYWAGQKLNAIKTIRAHGWMGSDKTATLELKFSKEFVESIFFH